MFSTLRTRSRASWIRLGSVTLALVLMIAAPFFAESKWLFLGILCMGMAIGAIGLTVLVGTAGQLSLAHGFFVAVGAYGYAFLAGSPEDPQLWGLGWPPLLAATGGVVLAALAGLLFSPVAARLRGLYLGLASLALVFIGEHILATARPLTGGPNGREIDPLAIAEFQLSGNDPDFSVFGVPFGMNERLWFVALFGIIVAIVVASRIVTGRSGRALQLLRDNTAAAAAMGVDVQRQKAEAFVFSSAFAGAAGVFLALSYQFIVPESFGLTMSINFLAMIIIGGMGSIGGAVAGAVIVTALPTLITLSSVALPFVSQTGGAGTITPGLLSQIIFGAAVIAILILEPGGLAGITRRLVRRIGFPTPAETVPIHSRTIGDGSPTRIKEKI
ncbi:branched-chain amino acid ABC transporter permease [Cryobacterium frigoriphilum]|uniref:branched-chain amino acid ABC transporter permease n=1 Tax=Cryobacterium frigoriphilum TaxID=1259150 RepID=UPI00141A6EF2|nr:branched-chain amino acid ABC transporter permease [Cryobacterium frigoriphilum]